MFTLNQEIGNSEMAENTVGSTLFHTLMLLIALAWLITDFWYAPILVRFYDRFYVWGQIQQFK